MDHIRISYRGSDKFRQIAEANCEQIKSEVLAEEMTAGEVTGYSKTWNINGEEVLLGVEKELD